LGVGSLGAQIPLDAPLPLDRAVRAGVLPNGLHYYVRANAVPAKRAELRLVVNAGSIVEDDDQRGMAHVIEHMAFNGTTHFRKNELVNYLQSIGVRFGADLNASTSFDETIYMLQVPTDTARIVEQAMTVLEDWAHGQLFDSTEVANERGVVVEEWRLGKGATDRMRQQYWPTVFRGSAYADRWTIGTEVSILSSTPALLRRFYRDWYRPDLMAVIAVGDFDPAQMESQIVRHFGGIRPAGSPRKRPLAEVPGNTEPVVAITSDREATNTSVQLLFKLPKQETKTANEFRRRLTGRLYSTMLTARLGEIAQQPNAPFAQAFAGTGSFVRGLDVFSVVALSKDGGALDATAAIMTEVRRVDQFGFLQSELDRAKQNMLRGYERAYAEREKTASSQIVNQYVANYLTGEPAPGVELEYELARRLLPAIELRDVNTMASTWITDENRVVIVQGPDNPTVKMPTRAEVLATVDRASKSAVSAYTETASTQALMATPPTPGSVVASRYMNGVGITEWTLSNGARVLVKPTEFKTDEVRFGAYSLGGSSVVPDADFMSAVLAAQVVYSSGLGPFSRVELGKKLAGRSVNLVPNISPTTEGLDGLASPNDLETLLQLAHMQFTAPRLDTAAVTALRSQFNTLLANQGASPERTVADTFTATMGSGHFRARPFTASTIAELNPERAFAIYRDRFADASDFTFVFVGNVDTTTLRPLAERYLASLPSTHRVETWRDAGIRAPTGIVEKVVRKGTEPKAMTYIAFSGSIDYSAQHRFDLQALVETARIKLIETLREKMSGTYAPAINAASAKIPVPQYSITASFGSSPENVEPLSRALFAAIDTLQQVGPSQTDVDKVKETLLRAREIELRQNNYWLSTIVARDMDREDIATTMAQYETMVKQLSAASIQQAARQYFNMKNYVRVVLLPEGTKTMP